MVEADEPPPIVRLERITKRFPGVVANDAVDLAIRAGEIHVLLGENGAGKSTLIAVLSGMQQPDEGAIQVGGRPARIRSPADAIALGIGTVYQHLTLVPSLSVLENLMLGGAWYLRPAARATRGRLAELSRLIGVEVEAEARVGDLSLGQQQQVEIIKALWRGERVLVLDEPTSMLTPQGVRDLGAILARLRSQGVAIVLITHKLAEACELADRISVLRLGRLVGEIPPAELSRLGEAEATARIVGLMFGREAAAGPDPCAGRQGPEPGPRPMLEVRRLSTFPADGIALQDVSFSVAAGETFGIAGIDGNGQKQLAEAIAGQISAAAGEILLDGRPIGGLSIAARQRLGLRYLTDDRLGEGVVGDLPLALNLLLKRIGEPPFWTRGMARDGAISSHAERLIDHYDVRTPGPQTAIGKLSGGNIQKALLARELSEPPKAVIYSKPTHGLDRAHTAAMRGRMRGQARDGAAAVVISTDLDELVEVCDRVGVMLRGRLRGIVEAGPSAAAEIGELMIGGRRP
jgi:simple sugar transport system ATP-binding protein